MWQQFREIFYSFHNNQTYILLELHIILFLFITFIFDYCKGDWAQDSRRILSNITACGYDITYLQKNPQRLG